MNRLAKPLNLVLSGLISLTLCTSLIPSVAFADDSKADGLGLSLQAAKVNSSILQASAAASDSAISGVLTEGWEQSGTCEWSIDTTGTLIIRPLGNGTSGILDDWGVSSPPWGELTESINKVLIEGSVKASTLYKFLYGCHTVTRVEGLSNLDVSAVENMGYAFCGCWSLPDLAISHWNTSNVESMFGVFSGCRSLTNLDLSLWDTSKATSMYEMFKDCSSLQNIDLSNWDVSNVESASSMFSSCESIVGLDLNSWNTSSLKNIRMMFYKCKSLQTLQVSEWNTSSIVSMSYTFDGCSSLQSIDVANWDTSHCQSIMYAFNGCSSLKELDLSGWDVREIHLYEISCSNVFGGCKSLTTLTLGKNWMSTWTSRNGSPRLWSPSGKIGAMEYTGNWVSRDALNKGPLSSEELLESFDPNTMSGTWVAEACFNIGDTTFTVGDQVYTGEPLLPKPLLKYGETTLQEGIDYILEYEDNTSIGIARIIATGIGSYAGTKEGSFKIIEPQQPSENDKNKPSSGTNASQSNSSSMTPTTSKPLGSFHFSKTQLTVLKGGTSNVRSLLVAGSTSGDNLKWASSNPGALSIGSSGIAKAKKAGSITITAKNGLGQTATIKVRIIDNAIKKASVKLNKKQFVFTGKTIKPKVTVKASGVTLKSGRQYKLKWKNNKGIGKASVTVIGIGKYKGKAKIEFKIIPKRSKITKLQSPQEGQLAVYLSSSKNASGYQIRYSTEKKMTKEVRYKKTDSNSITLGKLKKNTKYYLQARVYKTVNGKRYYSNWSPVKSKKTRCNHHWETRYRTYYYYICNHCNREFMNSQILYHRYYASIGNPYVSYGYYKSREVRYAVGRCCTKCGKI